VKQEISMPHHRARRVVTILVVTSFPVIACAQATERKWIGGGLTDNWTNPNNWLNLGTPDNQGNDTVRFTGDYARKFSDVNTSFNIGTLLFDEEDGLFGWIGSSYTVGGTGQISVGEVYNGSLRPQTVTATVLLRENGWIVTSGPGSGLTMGPTFLPPGRSTINAPGAPVTFNGGLQGGSLGAELEISGNYPTRLNAAGGFLGNYLVRSTLEYDFGSALGSLSSTINLQGGTLHRTSSGTTSLPVTISTTGYILVSSGDTVVHSGTMSVPDHARFIKSGGGTLELTGIVNGGGRTEVAAGRLRIAGSADLPDGVVDIDSGGTLEFANNTFDLIAGLNGSGLINLGTNSHLQIGSGTTLPGSGSFAGPVSGTGSRITKDGAGTFDLRGVSTYTGGTTIDAGTFLANNTSGSATGTGAIDVRSNALFGGDGAVAGSVTIRKDATIAPSNRATPGVGIGSLQVGSLTMNADSAMSIELGESSTADLLTVTGTAQLGGTLALSRVANLAITDFTPRRILLASSVLGQFSLVTGRQQSLTVWFAVLQGPGTVDVVRARPGDASLDGFVNFNDLLVLAQNYGRTTGQIWTNGDFDGNGDVAFTDLLSLAQNYQGASLQSDWAIAQAAVPEPTTLVLLGASMLGLARRR
jgi:autotransporter-associated beta strand protein